MKRYGMVLDLKRCFGCLSCVIACKAENATPPQVFWAQVKEEEVGKYPAATRIFFPILCNHCNEPPCRDACPTGATTKRDDGIVMVDYDKCIGCKACIGACPYGARYFLDKERYYYPEGPTPFEKVGYKRHQVGTTTKCNFCTDRISEGKEPACVDACIAKARYFGDLNELESEVSKLIRERNGVQLHPEWETDPSLYYLY